MSASRKKALIALVRGLLAAVGVTLILMVGIAALAVFVQVSDGLIMALNQVMKLAAILAGAFVAIGPGGERGFVTGMAVAMLYMALGYGCAVALGGAAFAPTQLLGEILIGAAIGAIAGAILANLPARSRRRARA